MLMARVDESDKLIRFEFGADDQITNRKDEPKQARMEERGNDGYSHLCSTCGTFILVFAWDRGKETIPMKNGERVGNLRATNQCTG